MGTYTVDSKELILVLSRAQGVISLGDRAESNSVTFRFHKKGIIVEATNSISSFQSSLAAEVTTPGSHRFCILPEILLSYAKAHKQLTLTPTEQSLKVTAGKAFSAEIYFVGENEPVDLEKPEDGSDIAKIAASVAHMLDMVSSMRNRTDQQALAVMVAWGEGVIELTLGDTHHAVVVDHAIKGKLSGKIVMTLANMQKIMSIGSHFAATESKFIAWSDTEYLSITNQAESVFMADSAREVIKEAKRTTKTTVDTAKFAAMIDTLVSAVDETASISFKITRDRILGLVKTGSSSAKYQIKAENFKGKEVDTSVTIHHLKDCLSTMKNKSTTISVFNNMLAFEATSDEYKCIAAMSAVGVR